MKKKLLLKHLFLLFALIVGAGSAWSQEKSYTLTFKTTGTTNDGNTSWSSSSSVSDVLSDGGSYVSSISAASNVYPARDGRGAKFGTTSKAGSITFALSEAGKVKATKVVIKGGAYISSNAAENASIKVNGGTAVSFNQTVTTFTPEEITYSFSTPTDIETLSLAQVNADKGRLYVISVSVYYEEGDTPSTYSVTYDANGATSGTVPTDDTEYDADNNTVTVLGNTGSLAKEHYSFNGWNTLADGTGTDRAVGSTFTISANTTLYAKWTINTYNVMLPAADTYGTYSMSATNPVAYGSEVTLTYTPAQGYENYQATWSVNGTELDGNKFTMPDEAVTVTVSVVKILSMVIDFESDATAYTDWTFTNIVSNYKNSGVDTYGGEKYGSTDGKASGSIQTKNKVNPASLTCYVSKQTTNSTSSTWYCQVSTDGTTWTDAGSRSATDMGKGEWKEFTVDLSTYSEVYVRVYYSGSTAVRLIDDLTLELKDADAPYISAEDVEIEATATSGSITYSIENPIDGTSLTPTTQADWISNFAVDAAKVTFTTTANPTAQPRTATVTLTYGSATKDVTVTQAAAPVVYTTIPALFAAATSTATNVNITFGNWVVSGVTSDGKTAYVTDNEGNGFIIYTSNHGFAVNDKLSGTVSGTPLKLYSGAAELTNLTATTAGLSVSNDGEITVITDKAIAALSGVNTGAVITLSNLTYDGTNLSDGTNTIKPYSTLFSGTFESGKTYNVTGVYLQYNTTKEILPRSADDIVEVVSTEPQIVANDVSIAYNATSGEIPVTIINPVANPTSWGAFTSADWISEPTFDLTNSKVTFTTTVNTGEARSATIEILYNGVSKNVTVTQAANEASVTPVAGYYEKVTSTDDITDGQYLIVYEGDANHNSVAFDGNLATLDVANNGIGVTIADNQIAATTETQAAEFTIDVNAGTIMSATGNYIGIGTNGNGLKQSTSATDYLNTFSIVEGKAVVKADFEGSIMYLNYNSDSGQTRFRYYKNASQKAIQLYKYISTVPAHVSNYKWATFSSDKDLDFTSLSGSVKAYIVTGDNGSTILIQQVYTAKAGTGLLLYSETAGDFEIPIAVEGEEYSDNKLIAVEEDNFEVGVPTAGTNYVLTVKNEKAVFAYINSTPATLNKGQAYLNLEGEESAPYLGFGDEGTTGIVNVNRETITNNQYYTLDGRRVENPSNGVYIVNGKKVVIK